MLQTRLLLCVTAAVAADEATVSPVAVSAERQTIPLRSFDSRTPQEQRAALRLLIRDHEAAVQRNSTRRDTRSSTYDEDACSYFPFYRLASLPATMGLNHREAVRAALQAPGAAVEELRAALLRHWQAAAERSVVVFGCKSVPYLRRQLAMDETHTFLVIDHSIKALANAAAALATEFGPRVRFLRADAMFAALAVLPRESVDTVVAPMPAPFWSEKGSHRRLVTTDFLCAAHRVLRERADPADPRGIVLFTDSEPYADFMVEQLTAARLMVPWTRKNPQEVYRRWLPADNVVTADVDGDRPATPMAREFPQQRCADIVAVAASKSGPTSEHALKLIESYNYKRKYYRAFNDGT